RATALHDTRDAAACGFNPTRRQLAVSRCLETKRAEAHLGGHMRRTRITALLHLAVLGSLRLHHDSVPYFAEDRRGARSSLASVFASCVAACRSKISPL